jgi:predicted deacylase
VPAIYVEHGGGGSCDRRRVEELVDGCLGLMAELGMIERQRELNTGACEIVEDDRPHSGFLQLHHPSPADGFFEPAVRLGERVTAQESMIGTVCDSLGERIDAVKAQTTGRVLMLRSCPRVIRGDALAVVLPDDAPRIGREVCS